LRTHRAGEEEGPQGSQVRCLRERQGRGGLRARLSDGRRHAHRPGALHRPGGRTQAMIHRNVLLYARGRYLWWSLALTLACVVLYFTQGDAQPPNGGTWQGYVLGTLGALLIVWLLALGIRKRRYSSTLGTVQGWTSAHVYLGSALLVIGTLHSGLQ